MDMSSVQLEHESSSKNMESSQFVAEGNSAKGEDSDECQSMDDNQKAALRLTVATMRLMAALGLSTEGTSAPDDGSCALSQDSTSVPTDNVTDSSSLPDDHGNEVQQNRRDPKGVEERRRQFALGSKGRDNDSNSDGNSREGDSQGATRISLADETTPPATRKPRKPSPQASQERSVFCTNCGARSKATFRFCTECGQKMAETIRQASHQNKAGKKTHARNNAGASQILVPVWPYQYYGQPMQQPMGLNPVAPVFVPASQARHSTNAPELTEALHGMLQEHAPGAMDEMKKTNESWESLLMQAMPDHYDD